MVHTPQVARDAAHLQPTEAAPRAAASLTAGPGAKLTRLHTLALPGFPRALAFNERTDRLYVLLGDESTAPAIRVFAAHSVTAVTTISLPVSADPSRLAIDDSLNQVYVLDAPNRRVFVVGGNTNTLLGQPISIGAAATDLAVNSASHRVYVVHQPGFVDTIDGVRRLVVAIATVPSATFGGIAVHTFTQFVYVVNLSGHVHILSPDGQRFSSTTIPVGAGPDAVAINPAGSRLVVGNRTSRSLSIINTATFSVIATVPVDGSPDWWQSIHRTIVSTSACRASARCRWSTA